MLKINFIAICVISLLLAEVSYAQQVIAPPVDQGPRDAGFVAFRADLLDAVSARDESFIMDHASDDILLSFGGDGGKAELGRILDNDPAFWTELETVLKLGGRFDGPDLFVAPYTWVFELPEPHDPFDSLFVTGSGVRVRAAPSLSAPVLTSLSHTVIKRSADGEASGPFQAVVLDTGQRGFIHRDFLRSPVDYRALFSRAGDTWQIDVFVAGD